MDEARVVVARRLLEQSVHCQRLGSALYAHLLARAAADVERGGPAWEVLAGHEDDAEGSALALRFLGAVHRVVLEGRAPALGRHYPSAGGSSGAADAWPALAAALVEHRDDLRRRVEDPVQTNDVGRSAALVGGFLLVASATGLPLRLLELGTSAGLNLRFDCYRYEGGDQGFGDRASPVRFSDVFIEPYPPFATPAQVVERAGCDPRPIDPTSEEGRKTLLAYTWPDQVGRLRQLDAAIEVARRVPVSLTKASAAAWLEDGLDRPVPGVATVVFHSIVMQYLGDHERQRIDELVAEAGSASRSSAPLARLAMEPRGELADVRLCLWPGGEERLVARAGYHGRPVHWHG
ncbi:MAG: DUF2332 domain-containing protein [Actinomycetota bacterium]|nr:DUF2332 domain-containing protein [Actinomycetota bacterium]